MADDAQEFSRLAGAVVTRFFAQNGKAAPAMVGSGDFGAGLWRIVEEHGSRRRDGASAKAGSFTEEALAGLVARVVAGEEDPLLSSAAKQLLKACLYPELGACRDSFREASSDGVCRRQERSRVLGRISGTHCVDCPHWVALAPAPHAEFLQREWLGPAQEFRDHRREFLPEDFRALRLWLHPRVRLNPSGAQ
jgi:hypothetical protein